MNSKAIVARLEDLDDHETISVGQRRKQSRTATEPGPRTRKLGGWGRRLYQAIDRCILERYGMKGYVFAVALGGELTTEGIYAV